MAEMQPDLVVFIHTAVHVTLLAMGTGALLQVISYSTLESHYGVTEAFVKFCHILHYTSCAALQQHLHCA